MTRKLTPGEVNQKHLQQLRAWEAKTLHRKMRRLGAPIDADGNLRHSADSLHSPAMEMVRECLAVGAEIGRNSWDTATLNVYLEKQSDMAQRYAKHLLTISHNFMQADGVKVFTDEYKSREGKSEIGPRGREFLVSVYTHSLECANTSQLVAWLARQVDSAYSRLGKPGMVGLYQLAQHVALQVKLMGQQYPDESPASADAMRYNVALKRANWEMTREWHEKTMPAMRRPLSGTAKPAHSKSQQAANRYYK